MDTNEFRKRGKEMVDFIADYLENLNERRVTPNIEPGYLRSLISLEPPKTSENWDDIMKDIEEKIMPGVIIYLFYSISTAMNAEYLLNSKITHWQHSKFHAYFPAGNSFPSILGDMLSTGLGINGFSWQASPACTELETIVMHWLGVMSGLPAQLLPFEETNDKYFEQNVDMIKEEDEEACDKVPKTLSSHWGGGVLLGSASECVLVSMLAARTKAISKFKREHGFEEDGKILTRLVAYTSKIAHSCVEKAAMICLVKIKLLDLDEEYSVRGETLRKAIQEDIEKGLIPFYVCGTFGTTGCCSFDNIGEMGPVCQNYGAYLHVDAAYAGNALICEEFRYLMKGIEYVDSFSYNPNKWMLINFDSSCLWVKDKYTLTKALSVDPVYLQYRQMEKAIDYRNWGISLSRRFRALKLWFTIRSYGVKGLQDYIRHHVDLAKEFEKLVLSDDRFEIFGKVSLGLVCFRLKGPDILSKNLLFLLNDSGKIHMIPSMINEKYVIRFCVNAKKSTLEDMITSWDLIKKAADETFMEYNSQFNSSLDESKSENEMNLSITRLKRKAFTRMTSEPTKLKSLYGPRLRSFEIDYNTKRDSNFNYFKAKSLDFDDVIYEDADSMNEI